MKVIICSDSHGAFAAAEQVLEQQPEAAAVLFLGDGAEEWDDLHEIYPQIPLTRCGATATGAATGRPNASWSWADTVFFAPTGTCTG